MDMDYKKSIGNIADCIIHYTFTELPKFNLIAGRISEDEFRKQMSFSPLIKAHHIEEIIITIRGIKNNSEKVKTSYLMTLRAVLTFEEMLQSSQNLSKVMNEINGKDTSMQVKKYLRYMKQTIAPSEFGEFQENLEDY